MTKNKKKLQKLFFKGSRKGWEGGSDQKCPKIIKEFTSNGIKNKKKPIYHHQLQRNKKITKKLITKN